MFQNIRKRDGNTVKFDSSKITAAITRAGKATGEFGKSEAKELTMRVLDLAHELRLGPLPDVEGIQDIVERVLFGTAFFKSAKAYILYREQHAQIRAIAARDSADLVDSYLMELDWKTLKLQDDLQTKYTGGTVLHIYLGEQVNDGEVLKQLIQKIVTNFRLPYFTITPTFSVCPGHGCRHRLSDWQLRS